MAAYKGIDGPDSLPPYEPGPNTTSLPDRPLTEAEIMEKLRGAFGLPAEASAAPEPAAEQPTQAEKALSWVDRLRATFGFPPAGSAEKRYDPDQPRAPKGSPDGGQWTSDVHSPDRRGRFSKVEARGLISLMVESGGFSYQPFDDYSPSDGYMVSPYPERSETMKQAEVSEKRFGRYVNRNNDALVEDNHFFGGWLDTETDTVWLDVSIRAKTPEEAQRLACEHDQIAYWDIKNMQEVRVEC